MASSRILQTLTWLSAIALGRSDVILINALNRSDKFLSAAEGLKCHTLRRRLGNPLRLSSLEGFGSHHSIRCRSAVQLIGPVPSILENTKINATFRAGDRWQKSGTPARVPRAKNDSLEEAQSGYETSCHRQRCTHSDREFQWRSQFSASDEIGQHRDRRSA